MVMVVFIMIKIKVSGYLCMDSMIRVMIQFR